MATIDEIIKALQGAGPALAATETQLQKVADHWAKIAEKAQNVVDSNEKIDEWTKNQAKIQLEVGRNQEILQDALKSEAKLKREIAEIEIAREKLIQRMRDDGTITLDTQKAIYDSEQDRIDTLEQLIKLGGVEKQQLIDELKLAQRIKNERLEQNEATLSGVKKLGAMLNVGVEFKDTMTGALVAMTKGGDNLGKAFKKVFSKEAMAGFLALSFEKQITSWVKLAFEADSLAAAFAKQTGATAQMRDTTDSAAQSLRRMGLGLSQAYEASVVLMDGITAFQTGTEESQKSLIKWTAVLGKAGVDMSAATKVFQSFNKSLGMSTEASQAATERIIQFGRAMNMNVNTVLADANALMPTLLAHGEKAEEVFKGMAVASRETSISMQNLFNVAKGFDTFEKAASSTAKLNAILGGGYLNSVEMVYATESERLIMLQKTLALSGKNFNSMGRFEKQALATAGGFSSVAEAANFFNSSLSMNSKQLEEQAARQEDMQKMAKAAMPVMEELTLMFQQMMIDLQPAIKGFASFIGFLVKILGAGDGAVAKILGIVFAITKLTAALKIMNLTFGMSPLGLMFRLGAGVLGAMGMGYLMPGGDSEEEVPSFQGGLRPTDTLPSKIINVHQNELLLRDGAVSKVQRPGRVATHGQRAAVVTSNATANLAQKEDIEKLIATFDQGVNKMVASNGDRVAMIDSDVLVRWGKKELLPGSFSPVNMS